MHKRTRILIFAFCMAAAVLGGCASSDKKDENDSGNASAASAETDASSVAEAEEPVFQLDPTPVSWVETAYPDLEEVKSQYSGNEAEIAEMLDGIAAGKDAPCINITTESDYPVVSKESYVASVIDVFNCDDEYRLSAAGGVKVRGNSSADQGDEKPYRIRFEEKHGMLGLHEG